MRVEFTERAHQAFQELLIFLLEEQEVPPKIVGRFGKRIREESFRLAEFPEMGQTERGLSQGAGREYRSILVERHFRVVYFIAQKEELIRITDVFDTRRDPSKMQP